MSSVTSGFWVWEQDADRLYTLSELDIGAFYLRGLETPFTLSVMGSDRGRIASTSFWLGEDGKAGLVQHLDLFLLGHASGSWDETRYPV